MKKSTSVALACGLILMVGAIASSQVAAKSDDHKILRKWDLNGSFVAHPGYNWGGLAEGATWNFGIHIKEALNDEYSVGSIHFATGEISVVGIVKETRADHPRWKTQLDGIPNLFACGTANYEGTQYYFMFLYAKRAIWFALSLESYELWLDLWPDSLIAYQLHSKVPDETFPFEPKVK